MQTENSNRNLCQKKCTKTVIVPYMQTENSNRNLSKK